MKQYLVKPDITVKVPGIAVLLGTFALSCKGSVLCASSSDCIEITFSLRTDNVVHVYNSVTREMKKFNLSTSKFRKEDHFANCVKGVFNAVSDDFPVLKGADICLGGAVVSFDSEMFETAASIGLLIALNRMYNLEIPTARFSDYVMRSVVRFCRGRSNNVLVTAMLCAKEGKYVLINTKDNTVEYIDDPFSDSSYSFIFTSSGISIGGMRDEKNRISDEVDCIVQKCGGKISREIAEQFSGERKKVALFVLDDCANAVSAAKALKEKDLAGFGKYLSKSGKILRVGLEFSCPETDWILKRSSELSGCIGSGIVFNGSDGVLAGVFKRDAWPEYSLKLVEYEHFFGLKVNFAEFKPQAAAEIIN